MMSLTVTTSRHRHSGDTLQGLIQALQMISVRCAMLRGMSSIVLKALHNAFACPLFRLMPVTALFWH